MAPRTKAEQKRQAAAISRKLLLRAHRLIRKVPHTQHYHLTDAGRTVVTALRTEYRGGEKK